ncbi:hypothetical protein VYF65_002199 [Lysinibacillus irui]|uniref:hypothetical protein n=1 Tax=Lysinibacillus irui TaxID=2998077 RepID=UPI0038857109
MRRKLFEKLKTPLARMVTSSERGETARKGVATAPREERTAQKSGHTARKGVATAPRRGRTAPKVVHTAPREEKSAPKDLRPAQIGCPNF